MLFFKSIFLHFKSLGGGRIVHKTYNFRKMIKPFAFKIFLSKIKIFLVRTKHTFQKTAKLKFKKIKISSKPRSKKISL